MKKFFATLFIISFAISITGAVFASTFYDVKGTVYEGTVNRIASLGIINGISSTAYAPNKSLTRGELAKIIVFTKGLNECAYEYGESDRFKDVKGHWAEKYINVAADMEILNGYDDGTFKPDKEVSNAEVIVMALRCLGYLNLTPQENGDWYSGYTKRMYELNLNKGMANLKSYDASAKRGDVAMLWWNMLVSNKWVVSSENAKNGLIYTYSDKTQLEEMFPNYTLVEGKITSILGNASGDILVVIGGKSYKTDSYVPLYAYGANAVGVSVKSSDNSETVYGLSIDDEYSDLKIVEGPIFYLEKCGYKLSRAKSTVTYGTKSKATYAYLIVSESGKDIYRAVLIDASKSYIVDTVSVNYDEISGDDATKTGKVSVNGVEIADLNSIVIKNGKGVEWSSVPRNSVLTELIRGKLYTYSTKSFDGTITDYSNLSNLYVNNDKYIVSDDCIFVVENNLDDGFEEYSYNDRMTKSKLSEYTLRDATFYLNVAEEIVKISFGKYEEEEKNKEEEYEDNEYQFLYVTSILYLSGDASTCRITGYAPFNSKRISYTIERNSDINGIGDFVVLHGIKGRTASEIYLIESSKKFGDFIVVYNSKSEYKNKYFGEYLVSDECKIYKVEKRYESNSLNEISECEIKEVESIDALGSLENYKLNFIVDEDMNIDVIYAETDLDKTTYPIARIESISKIKNTSENSNDIEKVSVKTKIFDIGRKTYTLNSGDCEVGELVLLETNENFEDAKIKERFRLELIGYARDFVVEKYDTKSKTASIEGCENVLNLNASEFKTSNKTYNLESYIFVFSTVSYDEKTCKWSFSTGKICDKKDIRLKEGDRIAFGELNKVAVVYRGYN